MARVEICEIISELNDEHLKYLSCEAIINPKSENFP